MKKQKPTFYKFDGNNIPKQQKEKEVLTEVEYYLDPKNNSSVKEFLEEFGKKLWLRPKWKKIPNTFYLICLYKNLFHSSLEFQTRIMHNPDQYERFVKSIDINCSWYYVSYWRVYQNSNLPR